ncbi:hypothetical protein EBR03_05520 [bacterium]|nr:hypothetical protein [bacterium]
MKKRDKTMTTKKIELFKKAEYLTGSPIAESIMRWMARNGFDDVEPNIERKETVEELLKGRIAWREMFKPGISFFVGFTEAIRPHTDEEAPIFMVEAALGLITDPERPISSQADQLKLYKILSETQDTPFPFRAVVSENIIILRFVGEMGEFQPDYMTFALPAFSRTVESLFLELNKELGIRPFYEARQSLKKIQEVTQGS